MYKNQIRLFNQTLRRIATFIRIILSKYRWQFIHRRNYSQFFLLWSIRPFIYSCLIYMFRYDFVIFYNI